MQRITVINIKGGCGKTTVATNLASAYAKKGLSTTLMDYDPQGSAMYWLNLRPPEAAELKGITAYSNTNMPVTRSWQLRLPPDTERAIIDTPAGLKGQKLIEQLRSTNTILIPVLPSAIDTHATADFIRDLFLIVKIRPSETRLGIITNRVKPNTLAHQALDRFLHTLGIPVVTRLRDTQNYVKAVDTGLGVHELDSRTNKQDINAWSEIIDWLENPTTN